MERNFGMGEVDDCSIDPSGFNKGDPLGQGRRSGFGKHRLQAKLQDINDEVSSEEELYERECIVPSTLLGEVKRQAFGVEPVLN